MSMSENLTLFEMPATSKARSRHYVMQRGYAHSPGTGPEGETCGSCKHCFRTRRFRKCKLREAAWTHGPGSDILARSSACKYWEAA